MTLGYNAPMDPAEYGYLPYLPLSISGDEVKKKTNGMFAQLSGRRGDQKEGGKVG